MSFIVKLLLIPCMVMACFHGTSSAEASAKKGIKIGIPLPLSGGLSSNGDDLKNSFLVAKELLHAYNIELIFEDDQCDPKQSLTIAKKLVEVDKVDAVSGIYCNNSLVPAARVYNETGIPVLTTGSTTGDVPGIGKEIFRLYPADNLAIPILLKEIKKRDRKVCMLSPLDIYTELMQRTMLRLFKELGDDYQIYAKEVDPSIKDYKTILISLIKNGCSGFYINPPSDDHFIAIFKQLRQFKSEIHIYGVYNPSSESVVRALGPSLRNVTFIDLPHPDHITSDVGANFLRVFENKYGKFKSVPALGLIAYEALRLLQLWSQGNKSLSELLRNKVIYDGAIQNYSFDSDGAVQGISFEVIHIN